MDTALKVTHHLGTGSSDATWDGGEIILGKKNDISVGTQIKEDIDVTSILGQFSELEGTAKSIQNKRMCFRKSMKEV